MINILLCCAHSQDVLNTYCWIHSTYTIPSAFWKRIGFDVAHPGVDKTQDPLERRYHKYYQWVCFCLFFQVWLILILSSSCIYQYQRAEIISEGCAKSGCNNTPPRSHYKQKHVGMSGSWILHSKFQAILFYIPRWLWKNWEAGKVADHFLSNIGRQICHETRGEICVILLSRLPPWQWISTLGSSRRGRSGWRRSWSLITSTAIWGEHFCLK